MCCLDTREIYCTDNVNYKKSMEKMKKKKKKSLSLLFYYSETCA